MPTTTTNEPPRDASRPGLWYEARRALIFAGIAALTVVIVLMLWWAKQVILLAFAGILVGILFDSIATAISRHTPINRGWAVLLIVLLLIGLAAGAYWLLADRVTTQVQQLSEKLPEAWQQLQHRLEQTRMGAWVNQHLQPRQTVVPNPQEAMAQATGMLRAVFEVFVALFVIGVVALYVAATPDWYARGIIRLVPVKHRPRAREVMDRLRETLKWWLFGKFMSMAVVGVLTGLGLWALGVPMEISLALFAAVLTFVPNFGPVISAVPAVLVGFLQGPMGAVWVALLYILVQTLESYLITPMIQQRTVRMPPVLTITAQMVMGVLAGVVGIALATPLTAALIVLVQSVYVHDLLGDRGVTEAE